MSFTLRPEAEADIESIASYIAADNPAAARKWLESMVLSCRRLGDLPEMGVARFDVRPGLRLRPVGNYLILYRIEGSSVDVVRVLHGARKWQELL